MDGYYIEVLQVRKEIWWHVKSEGNREIVVYSETYSSRQKAMQSAGDFSERTGIPIKKVSWK